MWRIRAAICLLIALTGCEPTYTPPRDDYNRPAADPLTGNVSSSGNSANTSSATPLDPPLYIVHVTGRISSGQSSADDRNALSADPPGADGRIAVSCGPISESGPPDIFGNPSGEAPTYDDAVQVDRQWGPYMTAEALCAASTPGAVWLDLCGVTTIDCNQYALAAQGAAQGRGQAGGALPTAPFSAWLECGDVLELDNCEVSKPCGVYVSGYATNSDARVEVRFPSQGGISVAPGDTSAPGYSLPNSGVTDLPTAYLPEMLRADCNAPAGQTQIPVQVWQSGVGEPITLWLTVNIPAQALQTALCPAQASATLGQAWVDGQDMVSLTGYAQDGVADIYFPLTVTVNDPRAIITYLRLDTVDANGWPLPQGNYAGWDTAANSLAFLGVYAAASNSWLSAPQQWMHAGLSSGRVDFTLVVSDPYGYLQQPGVFVRATVQFDYAAACVITSTP